MIEDPYRLLGVSRHAQAHEIRTAYRIQARQYHPDLNPGNPTSEERIKAVNAAYELLCDPVRRAAYDRTRESRSTDYQSTRTASRNAQERPYRWTVSDDPAPPPPKARRTLPSFRVERRLFVSIALILGFAWVMGAIDDSHPAPITLTIPATVAANALDNSTETFRQPATQAPTATSRAAGWDTTIQCEGWNEWVRNLDEADQRFEATHDEMANSVYATRAEYVRWAETITRHAEAARAVNPPPAATVYHDNYIETLSTLAEALRAYGDGRSRSGDKMWGQYESLYNRGMTYLVLANRTCVADYR